MTTPLNNPADYEPLWQPTEHERYKALKADIEASWARHVEACAKVGVLPISLLPVYETPDVAVPEDQC